MARLAMSVGRFRVRHDLVCQQAQSQIEGCGVRVIARETAEDALWLPSLRLLIVPPLFSPAGWERALLEVLWSSETCRP